MRLTPEQRAVVEAGTDPSRPPLTVVGYAGAAKTTTLLAMAKAKGEKGEDGSAFFFNRAMADEMRGGSSRTASPAWPPRRCTASRSAR